MHASAELSIEDEPGAAKWAVGDEDGAATDGVVHELVPHEDCEWVRAGLAADRNADHALFVAPRRSPDGNRLGCIEGRDAVARRAAVKDLSDGDHRWCEREAVALDVGGARVRSDR